MHLLKTYCNATETQGHHNGALPILYSLSMATVLIAIIDLAWVLGAWGAKALPNNYF